MCDPPRNQGAIAEETGIDRTVLTYLIDDLERLGLVVRRPDPTDRRSRLVVATDDGQAAWQQRRQALERVEAHVLSPLPAADRRAFRGLLQQLACGAQVRDPLDSLCEVAIDVQRTDQVPGPSEASRGRRRVRRAPTR